MKFLVVLDSRSVIGQTYLNGNNDGISDGHPCLSCTKLDSSHPHYLHVVREYARDGRSGTQTLHIPHHAVAFVAEYAHTEPAPFGFAPER